VKRTFKGAEPASLKTYRQAQPRATWDELRNDPHHGGQVAYTEIRTQTHQDQGGLCAYCEIDIRDNNSLKSRIEHFHPKSDKNPSINWALAWPNMLAVCAGGSYKHGSAPHTLEPLNENLSCDAHKDRLIQQKQLHEACEGWVLDPSGLPTSPSLFSINMLSGELRASEHSCANAPPWPNNQHASIVELVEHTIAVLNLNCHRLCEARLIVIRDIERNKKRQRAAGHTPQQGLENLARRYLQRRWPAFVTTIRLCLGPAADNYLQQVQYQY